VAHNVTLLLQPHQTAMKKMKEGGGRERKTAEVGENLIAPNDHNHRASYIPFNLSQRGNSSDLHPTRTEDLSFSQIVSSTVYLNIIQYFTHPR
jgi:hypothetical protein